MKDSTNRTINYLRVSITEFCNLRCKYCMPINGVLKKDKSEILTLEEIAIVVKQSIKMGITKVRLTGGEPLLRKDFITLVKEIGKEENLKDFSITTNGILLEQFAKPLKDAGINRINVSLDTLDPKKYKEITRGGNIEDVLNGLKKARQVGLGPIKLNTVLMGTINDNEIEELSKLVKENIVDELRFIELMPIGETAKWSKDYFISNEIVKEVLGLKKIDNNDISSPTEMFTMKTGERIGLINPISHKFCNTCNRIRLTTDGKIKPCLLSDLEIDVKESLRSGDNNLEQLLLEALAIKPKEHDMGNNGKPILRNMVQIGG